MKLIKNQTENRHKEPIVHGYARLQDRDIPINYSVDLGVVHADKE